MWNAGLDEAQAGIETARRIINNLRYAVDITLMAESEKPFDEGERKKVKKKKAGLKLNIQKTKIMESDLITSWQIDGDTMETLIGFFFWGSKITRECQRVLKLPHNCAHLTC